MDSKLKEYGKYEYYVELMRRIGLYVILKIFKINLRIYNDYIILEKYDRYVCSIED